ncbi:MAG TPA: molybdopterin-dependent oxidoreductase [Cyclobacteriaceae bacterium]|nr:molybdopterin-dependent oxidoreductase [Cyclobacteriaceae bacterium]
MISRRQALVTGLSSLGAALMLPGCTKPLPPTYGNILRMADNLTYMAHRALLPGQSLAREYSYSDVSSFPATGTTDPSKLSEDYARLSGTSFDDFRLSVEGQVSKPGLYSLADLMNLGRTTQITKHTCEEGWTAIAEWTGVQLGTLLQHAGILPSARFILFHTYDEWLDSIDMMDAFHPQTLIAYGMNGKTLPIQHGAPIRLRLERQIGYKSIKYIKKIEVSDKFVDYGEDIGWAWYTGI